MKKEKKNKLMRKSNSNFLGIEMYTEYREKKKQMTDL